jgi:hypothetical protein
VGGLVSWKGDAEADDCTFVDDADAFLSVETLAHIRTLLPGAAES